MNKLMRRAIKRTRLSYQAIGRKTGVSGQQIGRFMNGQRDLTLRTAEKLLPLLGLVLVETAKAN